ncbi:MAG: DUF6506 family protein [Burkholderiaceae bacterium]
MALSKFAFIVKGEGYVPSQHSAEMSSDSFMTLIYGVSNLDSAKKVSQKLVSEKIQLIELCGGFSLEEAEAIRQHIANAVPVGLVTYSKSEELELQRLFKPAI